MAAVHTIQWRVSAPDPASTGPHPWLMVVHPAALDAGTSTLERVSQAARELAVQSWAAEPVYPIDRHLDGIRVEAHYLGEYGTVVCAFPETPGSAYECYAGALAELTRGKVRLVSRAAFHQSRPRQDPVVAGPLLEPGDAQRLRAQLRLRLTGQILSDQATAAELAFGELAANTYNHGRAGQIAAFWRGDLLTVVAEDHGPGFPPSALLSGLLRKGWTTRPGSLGMGCTIIIALARRLTITTGPAFTGCTLELSLRSDWEVPPNGDGAVAGG